MPLRSIVRHYVLLWLLLYGAYNGREVDGFRAGHDAHRPLLQHICHHIHHVDCNRLIFASNNRQASYHDRIEPVGWLQLRACRPVSDNSHE